MISTRTIRYGTLDQPIQEEEKWQTQSTDLIMVFSTGTAPQEFRQMLNRVRQMSHKHQHPSSPHARGRHCQRLAQTIYQSTLDYR